MLILAEVGHAVSLWTFHVLGAVGPHQVPPIDTQVTDAAANMVEEVSRKALRLRQQGLTTGQVTEALRLTITKLLAMLPQN